MPRDREQLDPELADLAQRHGQHRAWFAKRQPQALSDLMSKLIAKRGYANRQASDRLQQAWRQAVGQPLCNCSQPVAVRRGRLEVVVANSLQLQELSFDKERILAALTHIAPELAITDLMLKVGRIKR